METETFKLVDEPHRSGSLVGSIEFFFSEHHVTADFCNLQPAVVNDEATEPVAIFANEVVGRLHFPVSFLPQVIEKFQDALAEHGEWTEELKNAPAAESEIPKTPSTPGYI